jgi:hypothetical protein
MAKYNIKITFISGESVVDTLGKYPLDDFRKLAEKSDVADIEIYE